MLSRKIADSTVRRLAIYLRFLEEFDGQGAATLSSEALAQRAGTTSAQVRKDLSFFGSFGKRGLGYDVRALARRLRTILGLNRQYRVLLVGAGRLAGALTQYAGLAESGFDICAVVDKDPVKIGSRWGRLVVSDVRDLERLVKRRRLELAILVTPADPAQGLVDRLTAAGIRAILNFAPVQLHVPPGVEVKNVNLVVELETLAYALQQGPPPLRRA